MDIYEQINLQDCPLCDGGSILEEEGNSGFYAMCLDCGAQTVIVDYKSEDDKLRAAQRAAHLWNIGKVLKMSPGE